MFVPRANKRGHAQLRPLRLLRELVHHQRGSRGRRLSERDGVGHVDVACRLHGRWLVAGGGATDSIGDAAEAILGLGGHDLVLLVLALRILLPLLPLPLPLRFLLPFTRPLLRDFLLLRAFEFLSRLPLFAYHFDWRLHRRSCLGGDGSRARGSGAGAAGDVEAGDGIPRSLGAASASTGPDDTSSSTIRGAISSVTWISSYDCGAGLGLSGNGWYGSSAPTSRRSASLW
ncbi:hypothetical protein K438DRAFT_527600 [Mycena galopus ATCC 62051]|nr:hypothetical protein K438DRAFT_527600 [Mycena galopus ATCC 62051]